MTILLRSSTQFLRRTVPIILLASTFLTALAANASDTLHEELAEENPTAISSAGYALNPGFNDGKFYLDRFSGPTTSDYRGRKIARLANGDTISVGLVPAYQQDNQADGFYNIGIVRYTASGVRVPWSWASPYGNFGNTYLIYPGSQTAGQLTPRFSAIKDVKVIGNRFYILADHTPVGGSRNVQLLTFSDEGAESGRFFGHLGVFAGAFNEDGGALLAHGSNIIGGANKLVAVATVWGGSGNYILAKRFNVGGANIVETDSTFGTNGETSIFLRQNAGGCATGVAVAGACPIIATSLGAGFRNLFNVGAYYIGADRLHSTGTGSNDWDGAVIKLNANGMLDTTFGATGSGAGNGFSFIQFDRGSKEDRTRALEVRTTGLGIPASPYRDEIYSVMYVAQLCSAATGVAKIDQDGAAVSSFGTGGKMSFGGWNNPADAQACAVYGPAQAFGAAISGSTLAIVGQGDIERQGQFIRAPMFTAVDIASGTVSQSLLTPISITGTSSPGDGVLYGVVGLGAEDFAVVGDTRDPLNGNHLLFATGQIGRDYIFANGFQ